MPQEPAAGTSDSAPEAPRVAVWRTGPIALLILGAGAMLLWWLWLALRYPYFYLADMDLLAPLEALNLNSGYEAYVPLHPGYGMYLVDSLTLRAAHSLGLVSVRDLSSLQAALSPLLPMAELTSFFRLHSPILVLGIALGIWGVACRIARLPAWLAIIVFLSIATSEGLAYQAAVIRVELYSVFFWSLALPVVVLAASPRKVISTTALLMLAGFLLGLAFLTKVQSGVHLAAAGLIFWMAREYAGGSQAEDPPARAARKTALIVAIMNLLVLLALLIASRYTTSQHFTLIGYVEQPGDYSGASIGRASAVVAGLIVLACLQLIPVGKSRITDLASTAAATATWVVNGGVVAILSPFALYQNPSTGLSYALHNLQNLVWTPLFRYRSSESTGDILAIVFQYHWWVIAAAGAAWLVAGIAIAFGGGPRRVPRLALATLWAVFAAAVLVAAVRTAPRDMVWLDSAFGLTTAGLIAMAVSASMRGRRVVLAAGALVAAFLVAGNVTRLAEFPRRMDTNYHIYGWTESPWLDSWFASARYNRIMADRYPTTESKTQAAQQAREHWRLRVMLGHVFQNADIDLASAGPVAAGEPVWRDHREWRIAEVPRGLESAHLVDPLGARLSRRGFLSHVSKHEEWLDRQIPPPADPVQALSILPRRDIDLYIFAAEEDIARMAAADNNIRRRGTGDQAMSFTVSNGAQTHRLVGAWFVQYSVLPLQDFTGPFFFVIRERELPPAFGANFKKAGAPKPAPSTPEESAPNEGVAAPESQ